MIPLIQNSRKCKLTCSDRKQISGCLGIGIGEKGLGGKDYKRAQETLGSDGFMGVYTYQNPPNCTF